MSGGAREWEKEGEECLVCQEAQEYFPNPMFDRQLIGAHKGYEGQHKIVMMRRHAPLADFHGADRLNSTTNHTGPKTKDTI